MCETKLVVSADGHVRGVHDWTGGFKPLKCPRKKATEDDILAIALRLEKAGQQEEALAYIERFFELQLQ